MCVSAAPAEFFGTTVFLGKKQHPLHGPVFVLGYQNTARNLAVSFDKGLVAKGVQVFDHDIYTIVLARDATYIPAELYRVPERKRPALNVPLFAFYARHYPDWPVVLCCFDNREAQEAAPLLLWYTSITPSYFLLPALDCHTGAVPNLLEPVETDHWVILGLDDFPPGIGATVNYRDAIPTAVRDFLPRRVIGRYFSGMMPNGDFGITDQTVRQGNLSQMARIGPVAA